MAQRKNIGKVVVTFPPTSATQEKEPISDSATYLITGGFGSLGLQLGEVLAARGASHIALLGRTPKSSEIVTRLAEIAGMDLRIFQTDVSDYSALASAMAEIERTMPPIKGVFHAAGVIQDGTVLALSSEQIRAVLSPKIHGAWNLHELTRGKDLDHFVLFSSAASVLGSPGQANYAAGNSFLDGLALHRAASGLPALSVAWGPFSGAGIAHDRHGKSRLEALGLRLIPPESGMESLIEILAETTSVTPVVLQANWNTVASAYGSRRPTLLRTLLPTIGEPSQSSGFANSARDMSRGLLTALAPEQRAPALEQHIRREISRVSEIPEDRLAIHEPLTALGLDSLAMMEFKTRMESSLQIILPTTLLAQGASIFELVSVALEQMFGSAGNGDRRAAESCPPANATHDLGLTLGFQER